MSLSRLCLHQVQSQHNSILKLPNKSKPTNPILAHQELPTRPNPYIFIIIIFFFLGKYTNFHKSKKYPLAITFTPNHIQSLKIEQIFLKMGKIFGRLKNNVFSDQIP
jgi:hypothetical protein